MEGCEWYLSVTAQEAQHGPVTRSNEDLGFHFQCKADYYLCVYDKLLCG